jgi:hypothetical protein
MQRRQLPADHRQSETRLARRVQKLLAVGHLENQIEAAVVGQQFVETSEDQRAFVAHRHVDRRGIGSLRPRAEGGALGARLRLPIALHARRGSLVSLGDLMFVSGSGRRVGGHGDLQC